MATAEWSGRVCAGYYHLRRERRGRWLRRRRRQRRVVVRQRRVRRQRGQGGDAGTNGFAGFGGSAGGGGWVGAVNFGPISVQGFGLFGHGGDGGNGGDVGAGSLSIQFGASGVTAAKVGCYTAMAATVVTPAAAEVPASKAAPVRWRRHSDRQRRGRREWGDRWDRSRQHHSGSRR